MGGKDLAVDAVALIVILVVMNPAMTGIDVHEWLGLVCFAVVFVHCIAHSGWMIDTVVGARDGLSTARKGNFVVDLLLVIALGVVMVSGLLVSGAVLPFFGFFAEGYYVWDPLHAISAKVFVALLVVHVAAHGKWLYSAVRGKLKRQAKGEADGYQ